MRRDSGEDGGGREARGGGRGLPKENRDGSHEEAGRSAQRKPSADAPRPYLLVAPPILWGDVDVVPGGRMPVQPAQALPTAASALQPFLVVAAALTAPPPTQKQKQKAGRPPRCHRSGRFLRVWRESGECGSGKKGLASVAGWAAQCALWRRWRPTLTLSVCSAGARGAAVCPRRPPPASALSPRAHHLSCAPHPTRLHPPPSQI